MKIYKKLLQQTSDNSTNDFIDWVETNLDNLDPVCEDPTPEEVHNIVSNFIFEYMGKEYEQIPILFFENTDGNLTEYYFFSDSDTLKHEKVIEDSKELELATRIYNYLDPWVRSDTTPEKIAEEMQLDPLAEIEFLLDELEHATT